jgi:diacylglycerol kinase (ATP)
MDALDRRGVQSRVPVLHTTISAPIPVTKIAIILNPSAHGERAHSFTEDLARLAPRASMRFTDGPGAARRFAEAAVAEGFHTVVAAGGDGTVNEVANGLAGSSAALGVLPVGTMNLFAKEHSLPEDLEGAWAVIRDGKTREIDVASANGQHFIQLAGIGFDAQVVKETTWENKRRFGPLSYVMSAAQVAWRKPPRIVVQSGSEKHEGSFVIIGNGRFYGTRLTVFPRARPDDGLLDILIFKHLSYLDIARYVGAIVIGKHTELSDVVYFQAPEVEVRSDEEVPVEMDGELSGALPATFRISGRLRLCVPGQ